MTKNNNRITMAHSIQKLPIELIANLQKSIKNPFTV